MPYNNGYSEEYLDRLEKNGNIQADNKAYSKRSSMCARSKQNLIN